jgi:hypothetical protein
VDQIDQLAGTCEMIGSAIGNACVLVFESVCWPVCTMMFANMSSWAPALGGACEGFCNACVAPCM